MVTIDISKITSDNVGDHIEELNNALEAIGVVTSVMATFRAYEAMPALADIKDDIRMALRRITEKWEVA